MSTNSPRGSIPAPTVRGSLSNGFQVFSDDVVPLLVAGFIVVAVQAICASVFVFVEHGMYITAGLYLLVVSPLEFGMAFVCLRAVRSGRVTLEHLIAVTGSYGSVVGAGVILSVASTLTIMSVMQSGSMIIVTVIGCALLCATRFVPFLVLEDYRGFVQRAIKPGRTPTVYALNKQGIVMHEGQLDPVGVWDALASAGRYRMDRLHRA